MENKWISVDENLPEVKKENDNWSDNVLAWCSGTLHIMSYGWVDEGDEGRGYVWANCYGLIDGDPEWDDNYTPTHWMPLPAEPTQIAQKEQSIIANVSGQSEQLPQLCQCTMKHEDCECDFYNKCSECGLPLR